ncbi:7649_t:CDS:2 [Acaulospora colombiana]|uniref:7649_t:CDS:1 n=1 Tax=Acaulospora colombiana TaxID=27376 RepID=A0ACA9MC14_9GLOM|nr:7649_t:CDS:2 [Acaulospora colombiana]
MAYELSSKTMWALSTIFIALIVTGTNIVDAQKSCCFSLASSLKTSPDQYQINVTASHVDSKKHNNNYATAISFPQGYIVLGNPSSPFSFLDCTVNQQISTSQYECQEQAEQDQYCTDLAAINDDSNSISLGPLGTWPKYAIIICGVILGLALVGACYLIYRRKVTAHDHKDTSVTPGSSDKRVDSIFNPSSLLRNEADNDDDDPPPEQLQKNTLIWIGNVTNDSHAIPKPNNHDSVKIIDMNYGLDNRKSNDHKRRVSGTTKKDSIHDSHSSTKLSKSSSVNDVQIHRQENIVSIKVVKRVEPHQENIVQDRIDRSRSHRSTKHELQREYSSRTKQLQREYSSRTKRDDRNDHSYDQDLVGNSQDLNLAISTREKKSRQEKPTKRENSDHDSDISSGDKSPLAFIALNKNLRTDASNILTQEDDDDRPLESILNARRSDTDDLRTSLSKRQSNNDHLTSEPDLGRNYYDSVLDEMLDASDYQDSERNSHKDSEEEYPIGEILERKRSEISSDDEVPIGVLKSR